MSSAKSVHVQLDEPVFAPLQATLHIDELLVDVHSTHFPEIIDFLFHLISPAYVFSLGLTDEFDLLIEVEHLDPVLVFFVLSLLVVHAALCVDHSSALKVFLQDKVV